MGKGGLYIGGALVLGGFADMGEDGYAARRAGGTGDVFSRDTGEKIGEDSGSGPKVTVSVPPRAADGKVPAPDGATAGYPTQTPQGSPMTPTTPAEAAAGSQVTQAGQLAQGGARPGVTISPNPRMGWCLPG